MASSMIRRFLSITTTVAESRSPRRWLTIVRRRLISESYVCSTEGLRLEARASGRVGAWALGIPDSPVLALGTRPVPASAGMGLGEESVATGSGFTTTGATATSGGAMNDRFVISWVMVAV